MATISDQLAADIQLAFNRYYTDLANQDQIFFGVGDVKITKQDGTTATVPSWNKVINDNAAKVTAISNAQDALNASAGKKDAANSWEEVNTFNRQPVFTRGISAQGSAEMETIELKHATPFIDFHFAKSTADFTHRLIASSADTLSVVGSHLSCQRDILAGGASKSIGDMLTDKSGYRGDVGVLQSSASMRCRMNGRGGFSDSAGAWGGFYIEELVGTEHRMVFMLDGFGKNANMFFRPDRSLELDTVRLNGGRTRTWTGIEANYLEVYVDGSARGINFFNSDSRLKEDVKNVAAGSAGRVIKQLRPVSYKFKDTEFSEGKRYSFGVIAQEAEKVIPDLIQTMSDDTKSIDPLAAIGLLLAHNRELQERIEKLEAKLG